MVSADVDPLAREIRPPIPYLSSVDDTAALRKIAHKIADGVDEFVSWIDDIRWDEARANVIAARSYWHPNGFAKLVLYSSADPELKIRLHVWPASHAGPRLGESNPHSHRWAFASTCIAGQGLRMIEYQEVGHDGAPYDRYRYGADATDSAALRTDGAVRLDRIAEPRVGRGQVYSCHTSVVHAVVPIGIDLTATLVIQGPICSPSTVVYRAPGLGDDQPNGALSEADLRALIGDVVAACVRQGDAHA